MEFTDLNDMIDQYLTLYDSNDNYDASEANACCKVTAMSAEDYNEAVAALIFDGDDN